MREFLLLNMRGGKEMRISNQQNYTQSTQTNTKIQHHNVFEGEKEKRMEILREKYTKIHQENLRQRDPEAHIFDKYTNPYSPKFRSDLTAEERNSAKKMELSLLRTNGEMRYFSFRDAAFRDKPLMNGLVENHEKRAFQREQVNNQIGELLKEAGISIPTGTNLTFTVNPNDFSVSVSGSKDELLLRQIEQLFNTEQNGQELYRHIFKSLDVESSQRSEEAERKYSLISTLRTTGYDLSKLERKDGKFLTPDGQDVFELYLNKMRANPYEKNYVMAAASHYGPTYYELTKNGFDALPDLTLSINYADGKLQDVGQQYNYSETGWLTALKNS